MKQQFNGILYQTQNEQSQRLSNKLRIDDLTVPVSWQETKQRLERMKKIGAADTARDGQLSREEFDAVTGDLKEEPCEQLHQNSYEHRHEVITYNWCQHKSQRGGPLRKIRDLSSLTRDLLG